MGLRAPALLVTFALIGMPGAAFAQTPERASAPPHSPPPPHPSAQSAQPGSGTPPATAPPPAGAAQPPNQEAYPGGPGTGYGPGPATYPPEAGPPPNAYTGGPNQRHTLEPLAPEPDEEDEGPRPFVSVTTGIFYYQVFGAGFGGTLGVHVLPRTVIEVDAYRASSLVPDELSDSLAVRVQQLLDDHFYVRGGLRYRVIEQKKVLDFDDYEEQYRQRDLGIDFAGGSRWDHGHLVLGIDFAGIYMPFQAFFAEEQTLDNSNGELLAADEQDLRLLVDVRLAYLYIGARF